MKRGNSLHVIGGWVVMCHQVYIDHRCFKFVESSTELIGQKEYRQVIAEINRKLTPTSGGTDWELVQQNGLILGQDVGFDFALSVYYTLANLKVNGLAGFADGLELLLASVNTDTTVTHSDRRELLDWLNNKAVAELKSVRPSYVSLRALYRCESYCDRLHYMLNKQQPAYPVNYETLGYVIFDFIDSIERQFHTLCRSGLAPEPAIVTTMNSPTGVHSHWWTGLAFLIGAGVGSGAWLMRWFI
jgi:type VI secretion system protein VasL